jgi:hypothetical protein
MSSAAELEAMAESLEQHAARLREEAAAKRASSSRSRSPLRLVRKLEPTAEQQATAEQVIAKLKRERK